MLTAVVWASISWGLIAAAVLVSGSLGARISIALLLLPIGIISVRIAVRVPKASVTIRNGGVDIVGPLKSRHVSLDDVDRFVVDAAGLHSETCVALAPTKGRRCLLWVTSCGLAAVPTAGTRVRLHELCDELNGALAQARIAAMR